MNNSIAYLLYLMGSLIVVVWVGKILHKNGKVFLENNCTDKQLANNTNNILYVGYCLVNSGFAFYTLQTSRTLLGAHQIIEFVSESLGSLLITLAIMHYLNMIFVPKIISLFTNKLINNQLGQARPNIKPNSHEL